MQAHHTRERTRVNFSFRADFPASLLLCAWLLFDSAIASADTQCTPNSFGESCVSQIDMRSFFQQAAQSQYQSQWCWAASISMVFAFSGHPVAQSRIVSEVYGSPVNMPAQAGIVMAQQLNRDWKDDRGSSFRSALNGVYDAYAGVYGLTNEQIISELSANRPLVIGARTHAMVLTSISYDKNVYGVTVRSATVYDPWPGNGLRTLAPDEMYPAHLGGSLIFLATARISEVPPASASNSSATGGGGGGGSITVGTLLLLLTLVALQAPATKRLSAHAWFRHALSQRW